MSVCDSRCGCISLTPIEIAEDAGEENVSSMLP